MINIAFTGGGTGGHIYPALAVAFELNKLYSGKYRLIWIGSSSGMDRRIVEDAGIEFFGVSSGKLRRYFSFKNFFDLFKVCAGFFAARKILKKQKIKMLFSKGGFVSVPPCAAAASLKITVFTHESDFSPGLATRINTRFALRTGGRIFTAYEDTAAFFPEAIRDRITVCGNPVRSAFRTADAARGKAFLGVDGNARILLVLGGSQGAKEINDLVCASLNELTESYTVVHQTGPGQSWDIKGSEKYKPFAYIKDEMPDVMAAAELVAGRSGAGIWEWAVCGNPMLLIPLTGSGTRGDQLENALFFEKKGAALILKGGEANPREFVKTVKLIADDNKKREEMAAASSVIGKIESVELIARILGESINEFKRD